MAFRNYFDNEFGKSRGLVNDKAMNGGNMGYYTPSPTLSQMSQGRDFKQDYNFKEQGLYQTGAPGVNQYVAQNSQVAFDKINRIARASGNNSSFGAGIGAGAGVGVGAGVGSGGTSFFVPNSGPDSPQSNDTGLGGPADATPAYLDRTAQMSYAQADAQTSIDNANKMAKARAAAQGLDYNPNAFDVAAQQSMVSSQANNAGVKTDIANVGFKNDFERIKMQEGYQDRRMLAQLKEQEKQAQMQNDAVRQENFLRQRMYNDSRKDLRARGRAAKQLLKELERRDFTQSTVPATQSTAPVTQSTASATQSNPNHYVAPYKKRDGVNGTINGVSVSDYMGDHLDDFDIIGNNVFY